MIFLAGAFAFFIIWISLKVADEPEADFVWIPIILLLICGLPFLIYR